MSAPFQAGDVVSVVNDRPARWHEPKSERLHIGDVFRVAKFYRGVPFGPGFPRSFIVRVGENEHVRCWDAYRFRKIVKADAQFTAAMLRCKPAPAPALRPAQVRA